MNIGQKLLDLRKSKNLSQEELAEKLAVTRQTISKWETNQSTPDFDKIKPICDLYGITADELINGEKRDEKTGEKISNADVKRKKAIGIGLGIFLYFIAISWISISVVSFQMDPVLASGIFLFIIGAATFIIVFSAINYKVKNNIINHEELKAENMVVKGINSIIGLIILIIYMLISFATMAWHITWILWIIYAIVTEIVKLIFMLKSGEQDEK